MHQYGLAADIVFADDAGRPTWKEPNKGDWKRFQEIATTEGLRGLGTEFPHVQLAGVDKQKIWEGHLPEESAFVGRDLLYTRNLEENIENWGQTPHLHLGILHPGAPPWRYEERPALEDMGSGR